VYTMSFAGSVARLIGQWTRTRVLRSLGPDRIVSREVIHHSKNTKLAGSG